MQRLDREATSRRVASLASQFSSSPVTVQMQRFNAAASETNGHRKEVRNRVCWLHPCCLRRGSAFASLEFEDGGVIVLQSTAEIGRGTSFMA
jgi:hypothetical protein